MSLQRPTFHLNLYVIFTMIKLVKVLSIEKCFHHFVYIFFHFLFQFIQWQKLNICTKHKNALNLLSTVLS